MLSYSKFKCEKFSDFSVMNQQTIIKHITYQKQPIREARVKTGTRSNRRPEPHSPYDPPALPDFSFSWTWLQQDRVVRAHIKSLQTASLYNKISCSQGSVTSCLKGKSYHSNTPQEEVWLLFTETSFLTVRNHRDPNYAHLCLYLHKKMKRPMKQANEHPQRITSNHKATDIQIKFAV